MINFIVGAMTIAFVLYVGSFFLNLLLMIIMLMIGGISVLIENVINLFKKDKDDNNKNKGR